MENKQKLLDVPFPTEIMTAEQLDNKFEEFHALIDEKIEEVKELIPSEPTDPTKIDEIKDLIQDDVLTALDTIEYKIDEMGDMIQMGSATYDLEDFTLPKMPLVED